MSESIARFRMQLLQSARVSTVPPAMASFVVRVCNSRKLSIDRVHRVNCDNVWMVSLGSLMFGIWFVVVCVSTPSKNTVKYMETF